MTMNENDKQAEPVAADHTGLIKRIDAAIERVTQGRGLMSIPADPRSDVDLVLSECKALLQGENPPFWATDTHPAQPVALDVGNLEYMGNSVSFIYQKMRAYKDGMGKVWQALRDNGIHPDGQTHAADAIRKALAQPAQPVQPAGAQGEPVAWMCSNSELIQRGYKKFSDSRSTDWSIPVYTAPPAAAINEVKNETNS